MDAHVKWATYSHQTKSASWVIARYFDKVKRPGRTDWVFGDRQSGAYLHRFA
jgi:RNA-directed DNA polymerase